MSIDRCKIHDIDFDTDYVEGCPRCAERTVSWFSCGAASAVATKLALNECDDLVIAYCEVAEEHPDNKRFLKDCEGPYLAIIKRSNANYSILLTHEGAIPYGM